MSVPRQTFEVKRMLAGLIKKVDQERRS